MSSFVVPNTDEGETDSSDDSESESESEEEEVTTDEGDTAHTSACVGAVGRRRAQQLAAVTHERDELRAQVNKLKAAARQAARKRRIASLSSGTSTRSRMALTKKARTRYVPVYSSSEHEDSASVPEHGGRLAPHGASALTPAPAPEPAPAPAGHDNDGTRPMVLDSPAARRKLADSTRRYLWEGPCSPQHLGLDDGVVGTDVPAWMRQNLQGPIRRYLACMTYMREHGLENNPNLQVDPAYTNVPLRMLLAGPPGSGKTWATACAVAELHKEFGDRVRILTLSVGALTAKFSGCAEQDVMNLFKYLHNPEDGVDATILFMDEADSLLGKANPGDPYAAKLLNQFLQELLCVGVPAKASGRHRTAHVTVVACTNWTNRLERSASSRFSRTLWFPAMTPSLARRILCRVWERMVKRTIISKRLDVASIQHALGNDYLDGVVSSQSLPGDTVDAIMDIMTSKDVRYLEARVQEAVLRHHATIDPSKYASASFSRALMCRMVLLPPPKLLLQVVREAKQLEHKGRKEEGQRATEAFRGVLRHAAGAGVGLLPTAPHTLGGKQAGGSPSPPAAAPDALASVQTALHKLQHQPTRVVA